MAERNHRLFVMCTTALVAAAIHSPTLAQEAEEAATLGDIVVTAERRTTNVQTTAMAVSAFSAEALERSQVDNIEDLSQLVPNVNFGQQFGNARIAIRGVGFDTISPGSEARVAYHLDGVYISRPSAGLAGFYDVDRIEVLRGPQGTLYGRNATAGSVNIISRAPDETPDGYGRVTVGSHGRIETEGAFGGGLADGVAARFAFRSERRDGYGENLATGEDADNRDTLSGRFRLRAEPTDRLRMDLIADYHQEDDSSNALHYFGAGNPNRTPVGIAFGGRVSPNYHDIYSDVASTNERENWGVQGQIRYDLSDTLTLNSLTAYRETEYRTQTDLDATDAPLTYYGQHENADQFTQELQLSGEFGRVNFITGAYYFREDIDSGLTVPFNHRILGGADRIVQGQDIGGQTETRAWALFGQADYALTPDLKLVLGLRYSKEDKHLDEYAQFDLVRTYDPANPVIPNRTQSLDASWSAFTPKVTVEYQPADNLFLYGTVSRGFKSGGFNVGGMQQPFEPEMIWNYEAGLKADWLDRRLRTNLSAFYYDYSDLQVTKVVNNVITTVNAAAAMIRGVEGEINWLATDNLRFDASFSLTDSEYRDFATSDPARAGLGVIDLSGNQLSQAPGYTLFVAGQYDIPTETAGVFSPRVEVSATDKVYFNAFNRDVASQPAYTLVNLLVNWESPSGNWTASAFVRNLADEEYIASAFVGTSLLADPVVGVAGPPRTWGLTAGYRF
ncbi:MAG: TonB-dependent receptor [Caulobacterales bacterium]|nr:TonB-dependent receptor [Caulobacterales bacterium]